MQSLNVKMRFSSIGFNVFHFRSQWTSTIGRHRQIDSSARIYLGLRSDQRIGLPLDRRLSGGRSGMFNVFLPLLRSQNSPSQVLNFFALITLMTA